MKKRTKSVLSGKGFYIALTLSVAMVGAACYFAYTQNTDEMTGEVNSGFGIASVTSIADNEQDVVRIHTDVTKSALSSEKASETLVTQEEAVLSVETEPEADSEAYSSEEVQETGKQSITFSMPVNGEVLNEFSGEELVKSKTTGAWQTHNGIDIKAAAGDVVLASGSGTVSAVESDPLWGVTVSIDHGNGIVTRYSNLNSGVTVQAGQQVSEGEEIGAVGETADIESKEETHLHFEAVKNGSYTNPLELIQ